MPDPTDLDIAYAMQEMLPDPLPASPFPLFLSWFNAAHERDIQPNPNSMSLATVDPDGTPSVRIVLCRKIDREREFIVFYTNRRSRKGRALAANPRAAVCFHWDRFDKQVRMEGLVVESPDEESDEYFFGRTIFKAIGAWASDQSEPIESREALLKRADDVIARFGLDPKKPDPYAVPRPPHWGGYRIWPRRVELWVGNSSRLHDRARWERDLTPTDDGFDTSAWRATRLQP